MRAVNQEGVEVERQRMAILRIIASSRRAVGSKVIARSLKEIYGIDLSERGVRYHLNLMDENHLTAKVSRRDGRVITAQGLAEIEDAMVADKVGFVIDRIELVSYQVTFNPSNRTGKVPINISLFAEKDFKKALAVMKAPVKARLCASHLVATAGAGEKLGELVIPEGMTGLATVCSLIINGTLLKAGIPIDSKFGGILQYKNNQPLRFTDLIEYSGSSLDPSEIFIAGRMTGVSSVVSEGSGKILANFREIPSICLDQAREVFSGLEQAGIYAPLLCGNPGKSVCGVPVGLGKAGLVLAGGLNPVAAAAEAGVSVNSKAMSGRIDYEQLVEFDAVKA